MTTADYLDLWLDTFVTPFRAPNTVACDRRAIRALPAALMRCELGELGGLELQAAINAKARKHPRAAQLMYSTLHTAMAKAVALHLIANSPMDACQRPIHKAQRAVVLTLSELRAYMDAARHEQCYPLLLLMATCGLRRGEALGLQWRAVDLEAGMVRVEQQRMRIAHGYQLRGLKSEASNRTLPIAPPVAAELRAWRASQTERAIAGWVYDTTPEQLTKAHNRAVQAAGVPHATLHGLRHSAATAMAAAGTPIKVLQGILGHSQYKLTADLYADHMTASIYAPHIATLGRQVLGM